LVETLPEEERRAPDAQRALTRALHALGVRYADLDKAQDALATWAKALRSDQGELAERIEKDVVAMCVSRAAAWQTSRRDEAITLLERGLQVVRDLKIQHTLAELM